MFWRKDTAPNTQHTHIKTRALGAAEECSFEREAASSTPRRTNLFFLPQNGPCPRLSAERGDELLPHAENAEREQRQLGVRKLKPARSTVTISCFHRACSREAPSQVVWRGRSTMFGRRARLARLYVLRWRRRRRLSTRPLSAARALYVAERRNERGARRSKEEEVAS